MLVHAGREDQLWSALRLQKTGRRRQVWEPASFGSRLRLSNSPKLGSGSPVTSLEGYLSAKQLAFKHHTALQERDTYASLLAFLPSPFSCQCFFFKP